VLQLLVRVDATSTKETITEQYPSVFDGLGEECEIRLRPDARPYATYTPRNVPLPLRSKAQQELDRMETLGVISKVDTPTEWCAGLVVIYRRRMEPRECAWT
jgi:hypothetical protein